MRLWGYVLGKRTAARQAIAEAMRGAGVTQELHDALQAANAWVEDVSMTVRTRALAAAARDEQDYTTRREHAE